MYGPSIVEQAPRAVLHIRALQPNGDSSNEEHGVIEITFPAPLVRDLDYMQTKNLNEIAQSDGDRRDHLFAEQDLFILRSFEDYDPSVEEGQLKIIKE